MTKHLDQLAEYLGILPSYADFGGKVRATPDETKRTLLSAMGNPAASDEDARERLNRIAFA